MIGPVLAFGALALWQYGFWRVQQNEREDLFAAALEIRSATGKPFLLVGRPGVEAISAYPCSPDVTIDLDPAVLRQCPGSGVVADVRGIPYPAGWFGVAVVSHVLEHLDSIESAARAWAELHRVADRVWLAYPRRGVITNWTHPEHMLWTEPGAGALLGVEERFEPFRRALIWPDGAIGYLGD